MPIPNFRINPYIQPYTGGLSQEFGEAVDQRMKTYEAAAEFDDVLGYQTDTLLQNVAPFDNDVAYARELMHDTRKTIENRAQKGDYENMLREVKRSARNFAGQIQPLLENQKRYNSYKENMRELYQTGKISIDTYSKAQAAALNNYKGIDRTNIQGSLFSGFIPSPDINVAKKVDEFLTGWKANGGVKLVPDGQGGYIKTTWEQADERSIAQAAQDYLQGDTEFSNYAQTQGAIGNVDRVNRETSEAILAGINKHGFIKQDVDLFWEPEWVNNNKKVLEYARAMTSVPSSATSNPNAVDVFEQLGLDIDEATGKVISSDAITRQNGKLYKYTDSEGRAIPHKEYVKQLAVNRLSTDPKDTQANKDRIRATGPRLVEITPEQAAAQSSEANQMLVQMASERFLKEAIASKTISPSLLDNQQGLNDYLRINAPRYSNPKYLTETRKQYSEAIKNAQQIYDNSRWDISQIPGAATPEFTMLKEDDIIANLTGQSIGILDTEIGGFRKGQKADVNSLLDKLTEDGFKIKSARRLGPLKYNPFNNIPAMSYAITLEDSDGKAKTMEIAASMQDQDIQPVQDVYNLYYKALSGEVPFYAPNSAIGPVQGKFRVRTTTDIDPKDGKRKPAGFVEVLDAQGNKLNTPGFPQNIPLSQFADVYKSIFAPNFVNKYINPKFLK